MRRDFTTPAEAAVQPSQPIPQVEPEPIEQPRTERRPTARSRKGETNYDRIMRIIGLLLAVGLIAALWILGAYFTIAFFEALGIKIWQYGQWAYLLPAAISGLEIGLWPGRLSNATGRIIWFLILLFDTATTAIGFINLFANYNIEALNITLPNVGPELAIVGSIIGLVLALAPEKAGRSLVTELRRELGV